MASGRGEADVHLTRMPRRGVGGGRAGAERLSVGVRRCVRGGPGSARIRVWPRRLADCTWRHECRAAVTADCSVIDGAVAERCSGRLQVAGVRESGGRVQRDTARRPERLNLPGLALRARSSCRRIAIAIVHLPLRARVVSWWPRNNRLFAGAPAGPAAVAASLLGAPVPAARWAAGAFGESSWVAGRQRWGAVVLAAGGGDGGADHE